MSKKTAENEFKKMLEKLFQEYEKQMMSEHIKSGTKQANIKKTKKRS